MKGIRFSGAIEWYSREFERCFYFFRGRAVTLESTCRDGEQRKVFINFSLTEIFL